MVLNNGGKNNKKKRLACYNFVMKIVATLVCSAGARNTLGPKIVATFVCASSQGQRTHSARTKNAIYCGHLRLCQQPRAAHSLRSDQLKSQKLARYVPKLIDNIWSGMGWEGGCLNNLNGESCNKFIVF